MHFSHQRAPSVFPQMFSQIFPINLKPQASQGLWGQPTCLEKVPCVCILRSWEMEGGPAPSCPTPFGPEGIENFSVHPLTLALMLTRVLCPLWITGLSTRATSCLYHLLSFSPSCLHSLSFPTGCYAPPGLKIKIAAMTVIGNVSAIKTTFSRVKHKLPSKLFFAELHFGMLCENMYLINLDW